MSEFNITVEGGKSVRLPTAGKYCDRDIMVTAEAGGGIDTSDATASADEILQGETAYVAGNKVTGTFTIDSELTTQDNLITQIQTALQNKASASEPVLQQKTVTPTKSSQSVTPDSNYDGLSKVTVNAIPSNYIIPSGTKTITTNGTHDVKSYTSATVNVAGEDVTAETNSYTAKLATLETAIAALETELQGKASGGSGGGSVETCTITFSDYTKTAQWYYTDANMTIQTHIGNGSAIVPINTLVLYFIDDLTIAAHAGPNGNVAIVKNYMNHGIFYAHGDGRIEVYDMGSA